MGMGQIIDYSEFILQIEKAVANGVATLDSGAKVPKTQISLTASDVGALSTETDPTVPSYTKSLSSNNAILTALNAATGLISSSRLPSYVDPIETYANLASFPGTGGLTKIYVDASNNKVYRWTGSFYLEISSVGSSDSANKLTTARTISTTGDASYSVSFDGSTNVSAGLTLATVNSNVGSFGSSNSIPSVTVNEKGQITAVSVNSIGNELIAFQGLPDTTGLVKKTGDGTYTLDSNTYLTSETDPSVPIFVKGLTSASDILTAIKTVDGTGSGLDADLVRGVNPSTFLTTETDPTVSSYTKTLTSNDAILTALNTASGTISASRLPSYVDDVLSYAALINFPGTGETGKIYVAEDTNKVYRWTGSVYVEISSAATADTALKLTTPRTIETTGDASYSVSFDGSANVSAALTLSTVNSNVGSFGSSSLIPSVTVNAKGQITAVSTNSIGNELVALQALADTAGFLKKVSDGVYSIDTATYLTANQSITVSGDASGSGTTAISLTLANSGVTAGTYNALATQVRPFVVDAKGRITGVGVPVDITPPWSAITSKPTTLSGYGITDAQPLGNELTALQALPDTGGYIRKTGDGAYAIDATAYQPLDSDLTTIAALSQTNRYTIFSDGTTWTTRQIDAANDFTGTLPIGRGGTGATTFPTGRILFGGGGFGTIPTTASLFWDNTNRFLGIGAATAPAYTLDVSGTSKISGIALFTSSTASTSPTTGASVITGGQGIGGNQQIGGFSSLGGDANHPPIKIKVLTGTTAATEGGTTSVAHSLNSQKIIGVSLIISHFSASTGIPGGYDIAAGYRVNWSFDATNFLVLNHPTDSENVLSKAFTATVIYKE